MAEMTPEIAALSRELEICRRTLIALGDETRQHLMLEMMRIGKCEGVRVGEITQGTHLSRPAVSHHLKVLREAGIVKMRREGTKNYYYFDADAGAMNDLIHFFTHAQSIMEHLPDRSKAIGCTKKGDSL